MGDVSSIAVQDDQETRTQAPIVRTLVLIALVLLVVSTVGTFFFLGESTTIIQALRAHGSPWGNSEYFSTFGIGEPYNLAITLEGLAVVTCIFLLLAVVRLPKERAKSNVVTAFVLLSVIIVVLLVGNWLTWGDVLGTVNVVIGVPFPDPWSTLYRALNSRGLEEYWLYDSPSYWAPFDSTPTDHAEFGYSVSTAYMVSYYLFALMRTTALVLIGVAVSKCNRKPSAPDLVPIQGSGWYPSPSDPSRNLFWDGQRWHESMPALQETESGSADIASELPVSQLNVQVPTPKISSLAVASFVSAFLLPVLVPIVLGHVAKRQIRKSQGTQSGSGFATTALILGYLSLAGFFLIMSGVIHGTPSQSSPSDIAPITGSSDYSDGYNRGLVYISSVNGESYFSPSDDCSTILQLIKANGTYIPDNDFLWTSGCIAGISSY